MKSFAHITLLSPTLFAAAPALAHHGVTAHYDLGKAVVLEGSVIKLDLRNPHSTISLAVAGRDGRSEEWHCEMHGSTILKRMDITADTLRPGTKLRIEGFAHRRDDHGCYFDVGILESGRRLELGFLTGEQVAKSGKDAAKGKIFGTWMRKDFAVSQTVRRNFDVPLTPEGLAAHAAYDPIRDDPTHQCSPVSQIRVWGMATQPTVISQQNDGDILIRHEWMDVRRPIDLPPYDTKAAAPAVLGHSRAEWKGDTLVITTTGFTKGVLNQFVENFAGRTSTGVLHSDRMTMTETLAIDPATDELVLNWTVNDPAYFTQPFSGNQRMVRSDLEIQPYNCVPDKQ